MHPLSLLTHRARLSALDVKRLDTLPWKEDIKLGVVAIVDISGYTKLTDSLARVGNGERIREILNPPFELIIKAIHKHGGAIIKFAGDSVIAIWTPWRSSTQEFNGKAAEEELVEKCITCCSELMCMFKDYRLIIPERLTGYNTVSIRPGTAEGYDSGTGRSASRRNSAGWRNNSRTKDGKGLQRRPTEAGGKQKMREEESSEAEDEAKSEHQSLRIHIGVGVGSFRHVFLGSNVSVPGIVIDDKELDEEVDNMMRIEQFVSGPAVQEAGQMLMESATGELAFPSRVLDIMKTSLTLEPDLGELLSGSSKSSKRQLKEDNFFIIGAHFDTILRLLMKHSQPIMSLLATDAPPWISFEGTLPSLAISLEASRLALPFMDESLQKFVELALSSIQRIVSLQPETLKEEGMSEKDKGQPTRARGKSIRRRRKSDGVNKIDENGEAFAAIQLDDYNQLRRVSVVFLQVQGIPLEDIGDDGNLQKLQSLMCAVSSAVRKQGGCLRQFNCDEKGLCALLVWGLEGFSHEKGNAQPAILAAVEIKEQISRMFGSSFSIGVATGQVFAGVIGDEYRADGTILGPCVNLAARIMCQRVCKAKVLCDSVTYHDCLGELEFNSKYPAMFLKGVQDAVQVHEPILGNQIPQTDNKAEKAPSVRTASSKTNLKVNEDIMVAGRTKERNAVSDGIGAWYRGERTSVLITGKSGTGKTFLVKSILQTLKKDSSVIICHATGQENRQSAFFIFEYVIEAISTHLHASGWTAFRIRMCRQAMSKDLSSQTTFKEEFSSLPQTPSRRDSLTSGYGKSLLIKPGNNKRTSSAQRSSANVIFKMESAEMVARQRTASIAVEDPLSELLLALGEPLSTIELMKSLFPRLFGQFTRIVMPTAQDVGPRLLSYVSRILQTLFKMGLRTVFILDDVQWFDSGSYDVAIEMGIRCPFLLTVFISRPFEEYKESLKSRFLSISEPKHCIKIDLSKLDRDAVGEIIKFRFNHIMKESDKVSASLLNDVFQKSQGNPLAVRILCGILLQDETIQLEDGVLSRKASAEFTSTTLPLDTNSAVIAQFDKLAANMKAILRVAAVAGQYFHLEEIHYVLNATESILSDTISMDEMRQLLQGADPFDLVQWNNSDGRFFFSHYLIHQGIYSSLVPSRREELHSLYAEYYEASIETHNQKDNVISVINHLLKVPGEEDRKKKYLYAAFVLSVEKRRSLEGLEYYNLYQEYLLILPDEKEKGVLEEAQEFRLLSQLYFEAKDWPKAMAYFRLAMKLYGYNFPAQGTELPKTIFRGVQALLFGLSLAKNNERRRFLRCFDRSARLFPYAFRSFDKRLVRRHYSNLKRVKKVGNDDSATNSVRSESYLSLELAKFHKITAELIELFETGVYICYHAKPTLDVALLCGILLMMHTAGVSDYGVICTHYGRVSNCLDTIGMPNASDRLNQVAVESLPSTHETYTEIIAMTQYAETRAILHDVRGEWEQSAACYKLQLTALDSVADGAAPVPWLNRLVESLVRQLYGDISVLNSYIDKVYSDMYAGKDDTFDTAMIKVLLAGIRAMVGDLDGANQMYGESVKGVKKFEGHPEENGWMSLFASLHLLRYEMVKYRYSESESSREGWAIKILASLKFAIHGLNKLTKFQYAHATPLYMNCIPLLCDVVLDQFEFRQDTDHVMGTDATIPVSQRSLPSQIFEAVREIISIIKVHGKQYFPPRPHMTQYYALIWPTIEQVCRNGSLASFADKLLEDVEKCRNKWPFVGSAENHVWKLLASSLRARRVLAQNKSFMESAAPKPRKKKRGAVLPEDTYSAEKVAELLCGHGLIMDAKILLSRN